VLFKQREKAQLVYFSFKSGTSFFSLSQQLFWKLDRTGRILNGVSNETISTFFKNKYQEQKHLRTSKIRLAAHQMTALVIK
jgi:hypothetical protein